MDSTATGRIAGLMLCFFAGILAMPPALLADVVITAGLDDNFAAPSDSVQPSAVLASQMSHYGGLQAYDVIAGVGGGLADHQVAHTFRDLPAGITSAQLTFRARGGSLAGVGNDGLVFAFAQSDTAYFPNLIAYWRTFGPFLGGGSWYPDPDPGLFTFWAAGRTETITLDLSALPLAGGGTLNLVPLLAQKRFLDFIVSDETGVDFARLSVQVGATSVAASDPAAFSPSRAWIDGPNPSRGAVRIGFSLGHAGPFSLEAYDARGRRVWETRGNGTEGLGSLTWEGKDDMGRDLSSGFYLLRFQGPETSTSLKVLRLN